MEVVGSHEHHAVRDGWSPTDERARGCGPACDAGLRIEGPQLFLVRAHVDDPARRGRRAAHLPDVPAPDLRPRLGVQGDEVAGVRPDVHQPVRHQRTGHEHGAAGEGLPPERTGRRAERVEVPIVRSHVQDVAHHGRCGLDDPSRGVGPSNRPRGRVHTPHRSIGGAEIHQPPSHHGRPGDRGRHLGCVLQPQVIDVVHPDGADVGIEAGPRRRVVELPPLQSTLGDRLRGRIPSESRIAVSGDRHQRHRDGQTECRQGRPKRAGQPPPRLATSQATSLR